VMAAMVAATINLKRKDSDYLRLPNLAAMSKCLSPFYFIKKIYRAFI